MSQNENETSGNCDSDGRNVCQVFCKQCSCLILRPKQALFAEKEIELPSTEVAKAVNGDNNSEKANETLNEHWCVDNIYTFENMGFSNTVNDTKFLVCAECEFGPLGVHYINQKKSYLSWQRIANKI